MFRAPNFTRPTLLVLTAMAGWFSSALSGATPEPTAATAATVTPAREIATGAFQPDWNSLVHYVCPDWFRDAKFGIWARWDAQSVPERGDDYARNLYIQTDPRLPRANADYVWQIDHYGHPTESGFKDLIPHWTADQWEPGKLITLYQRAGARYFVALANDHDNFDNYNSTYQTWNSVKLGPKKDLVGGWAEAARAAGLRFGVTVLAADAWKWFEPAQQSDTSGPFFGENYDGRMNQEQGHGKWWDGLDPQELYAQNHLIGAKSDAAYVTRFFLRTRELLDRYHPDLLDFDTTELPLGEAGLNLAAHFYNSNLAAHQGKLEAVITAQSPTVLRQAALVETDERASSNQIRLDPWQAETSLGQWQYHAGQTYRSVTQIVQLLVDVVSKNGNLLLNVPLRGSGVPDADEVKILDGLASWISVQGEGIYATRPWQVFGEGPSFSHAPPDGVLAETKLSFTAEDIRYTQSKDGRVLYAFCFGWPKSGQLTLKSLAQTGATGNLKGKRIASVSLLGSPAVIHWTQDTAGLQVILPASAPNEVAWALKIGLE